MLLSSFICSFVCSQPCGFVDSHFVWWAMLYRSFVLIFELYEVWSQLVLVPFQPVPLISGHSFTFWHQAHLVLLWPRLRASHSSKELDFCLGGGRYLENKLWVLSVLVTGMLLLPDLFGEQAGEKHMHTHVGIHTHTHTHTHTYAYACTHVCSPHLHIYTHTYAHTHTQTHTLKDTFLLTAPIPIQHHRVLQCPPFHIHASLVSEKPASFNLRWLIHLLHPLSIPVLWPSRLWSHPILTLASPGPPAPARWLSMGCTEKRRQAGGRKKEKNRPTGMGWFL